MLPTKKLYDTYVGHALQFGLHLIVQFLNIFAGHSFVSLIPKFIRDFGP